jgi:hypothetical protein
VITLFRTRRRPVRRPYVRRLEVEFLEGRDAPTLLDPTSTVSSTSLVQPVDQQLTQTLSAPAPTDSSTTPGDTVNSAATSTTTSSSGTSGSTAAGLAPVTTVPTVTTTTSTTTTTTATADAGTTAVPPAVPTAPATTLSATGPLAADSTGGLTIDDIGPAVNGDGTVTISGHVSGATAAGSTVTISGWVVDGAHTTVGADGSFTLTVEVPACDSAATANHTVSAQAGDGQGHTSPAVSFVISQTPPVLGQ